MSEKEKLFTVLVASGFLIWVSRQLHMTSYSPADFVNPEAVREIAESLDARKEDEFIIAAWNFVSDNIQYESKESDLYFEDGLVRCRDCYLPLSTLKKSRGNCVAMASLLASILRNRLPPERVLMSVGEIKFNGMGGHSWVEVQRHDGNWYIIEATTRPKGWTRRDAMTSYYLPMTLMNDRYIDCFSSEICKVKIGKCGGEYARL